MKPIDILELAKPEIDHAKLKWEIINRLRALKKQGMNNEQILEVIKKMDLPLGLHLAITGNFSKLIG